MLGPDDQQERLDRALSLAKRPAHGQRIGRILAGDDDGASPSVDRGTTLIGLRLDD